MAASAAWAGAFLPWTQSQRRYDRNPERPTATCHVRQRTTKRDCPARSGERPSIGLG